MTLKGLIFIGHHWKLIIHLLWHTKRFGVNNKSFSDFDSILSTHNRGMRYTLQNYRAAKFRATACGFLTRDECKALGWKSEI